MSSVLKVNELQTSGGVQTVQFDPLTGLITLPLGRVSTSSGTSNAYGTRTVSNTTPTGGADGDVHFQYT